MNWTMPGVLDIYSVGDGELLFQIINTLAMFNNIGMLKSLAMIGLMIGLLIGPLKYIVAGGKDADLSGPFAAIFMVMLFFGGTATVRIRDVSGANSGGAVPTYDVANVPAGIAIVGWVVSNVGFKIAERYEQGFTHTSQQMTKTGFGRSAEMLASIRQARDCIGSARVKDFCLTLVNYLRDCSTAAFVADPTRASKAMLTADPLDSTNGFGVDTGWISTTMVVGGVASTVTCSTALLSLRDRGQTNNLVMEEFSQAALGENLPQQADSNSANRIGGAYEAINRSVTDAKNMMLAEMIRGSWAKAMVGNPNLNSEQELAYIAMVEASEQSATKAAMQDTFFRQFMQPLLAVVEALFYVVAPFLAIALGLGRIGASFALKIAVFALWSMTWMPALSFINFYQLFMVERAVDAMTTLNSISSYAGAQRVGEGITRWVTVGSWIAAATPAITFAILQGSASGLVKIAGMASGGADGKEKGLSPDATNQSPAMQTSALATSTAGGGIVKTGAPEVGMDFGRVASNMVESTSSAANASSASWMISHGKTVGNALTSDWSLGAGASAKDGYEGRNSEAILKEALKDSGLNFDTSNRVAQQFVMGLALSSGVSGGISTDAVMGALKKLSAPVLGAITGAAGGSGESSTQMKHSGSSAKMGVGVNGGMTTEDSIRDTAETMANAANALSAHLKDSHSARSEVIGAASDALERTSRLTGGNKDTASKGSDWKKDAQDVQRTEEAFRSAQAFQQSASMGERFTVPQAVAALRASPEAAAAINGAANQYGNYDARRATLAAVNASGHYPSDSDGSQAMLASSIMMLAGETMGIGQPSGFADERGAALVGALRSVGLVQTGGGFAAGGISGEAPTSTVDTSAVQKGSTEQAVEDAGVGAPKGTEGRATSTFENLATPEGSEAAQNEAAKHVGTNADRVRSASADAEANKSDTPGGAAEFGGGSGARAAVGETHQEDKAGVKARQNIVADQLQNQAAVQDADGFAGTGYAGIGGSATSFGLQLAVGSMKPAAVRSGSDSARTDDNPQLRQAQNYASQGGYTEAREIDNPDAALVLGAMALENKEGGYKGALSSAQQQMVRDAWSRLSDREKHDIGRLNDTWHIGEEAPRSVPADAFVKQ